MCRKVDSYDSPKLNWHLFLLFGSFEKEINLNKINHIDLSKIDLRFQSKSFRY